MSLDVSLREPAIETKYPYKYSYHGLLYTTNITHNLNKMAMKAGIYEACWRPEEINAVIAKDIIPLLEDGYKKLMDEPKYFEQFNARNGYGTYEDFTSWVREYLDACKEYPNAIIKVSR